MRPQKTNMHTFFRVVSLLLLTVYFTSCNSNNVNANRKNAFKHALISSQEFNDFAGHPLDNTFSDAKSVKIIYDIHANEIYFINSNFYELHFDFCENELNYNLGLEIFNATNYSNNARRDYYLATLNYFKNANTYGLEFFADNEMTADQISFFYDKVASSFFEKNKLKLFLNNENINSIYVLNKMTLPVISVDDVYKNQQYQNIQTGTSVGILKIIDSTIDFKKENLSNNIVVVQGTPIEMPICKGFISSAFQTPLSHIQVLAHHRNIPTAALKNCMSEFKKFNNKTVRLITNRDSILIVEISNEEYEKELKKRVIRTPIKLDYDTTLQAVLPIDEVKKIHKTALGAKAYNFSQLYYLSNKKMLFNTPESAYVIPYFFYKKHIEQANIQAEIKKLTALNSSNEDIRNQLKKIQKAIKEAPIDKALLESIQQKLSTSKFTAFRFRSSCNAEDLANFSGAGLYDSYTGKLNDSTKTIEEAIKKVWASTYNFRAYNERKEFGIIEESVMMGVLVHRSFPDEKSNGVVITKNIYREGYPAIIINAQVGDNSVVNPENGNTCDQIICSSASMINPFSTKLAIKYVSKSSLTNGEKVLSAQEITRLNNAVEYIKNYFKYTPYIDLEFKFDKQNKLYIKQVRPYQ